MNFDFTEEQEMLRESVIKLMARHAPPEALRAAGARQQILTPATPRPMALSSSDGTSVAYVEACAHDTHISSNLRGE